MIMRIQTVFLPALFLYASVCAAFACSEGVTTDCLLEAAHDALPSIESRADWVDAALELARAEAAVGRKREAMTLLLKAVARAGGEPDPKSRASQLTAGAEALALQQAEGLAADVFSAAERALEQIPAGDKRSDLLGRLLAARAIMEGVPSVLSAALAMPEETETQSSYRARTLEELATLRAQEDFAAATAIVGGISSGLRYYQAVGYAHSAAEAAGHAGEDELLAALAAASDAARSLSEGYFVAGALREAAVVMDTLKQSDRADRLFSEAVAAAREAGSLQQQARAISRIASEMADIKRHTAARALLPEASKIAQQEPSEQLRLWSYYEICGSAAFAGDFQLANTVLSEIPSDIVLFGRPLYAAAQRDMVFGLTRHRRLEEGLAMAARIGPARERVQALSRMIGLLVDPGQPALPRYL